jgi:hypothetical protein
MSDAVFAAAGSTSMAGDSVLLPWSYVSHVSHRLRSCLSRQAESLLVELIDEFQRSQPSAPAVFQLECYGVKQSEWDGFDERESKAIDRPRREATNMEGQKQVDNRMVEWERTDVTKAELQGIDDKDGRVEGKEMNRRANVGLGYDNVEKAMVKCNKASLCSMQASFVQHRSGWCMCRVPFQTVDPRMWERTTRV